MFSSTPNSPSSVDHHQTYRIEVFVVFDPNDETTAVETRSLHWRWQEDLCGVMRRRPLVCFYSWFCRSSFRWTNKKDFSQKQKPARLSSAEQCARIDAMKGCAQTEKNADSADLFSSIWLSWSQVIEDRISLFDFHRRLSQIDALVSNCSLRYWRGHLFSIYFWFRERETRSDFSSAPLKARNRLFSRSSFPLVFSWQCNGIDRLAPSRSFLHAVHSTACRHSESGQMYVLWCGMSLSYILLYRIDFMDKMCNNEAMVLDGDFKPGTWFQLTSSSKYQPNLSCTLKFRAAQPTQKFVITVEKMDITDCPADSLRIFDGTTLLNKDVKQQCGKPASFTFTVRREARVDRSIKASSLDQHKSSELHLHEQCCHWIHRLSSSHCSSFPRSVRLIFAHWRIFLLTTVSV